LISSGSFHMLILPKYAPVDKETPKIYSSPRIGLGLSNPTVQPDSSDLRVAFVGRNYRYFIHPSRLKVNGRAQTFVAVFRDLERNKGLSQAEFIISLPIMNAGFSKKTGERYAKLYVDGFDNGTLEDFVGKVPKEKWGSVDVILPLIGTLDRLKLM